MDRGKEDEDEEGEGGWRVLRWSMEVGAIALFLSPSSPPPSAVEEEADCAKKKKGNRGSGICSDFFWVVLKRRVGFLTCIDWG